MLMPDSIEATLPENTEDKRGLQNSLRLPRIVAIAESLKHRNAMGEDKAETDELDKLVAPWFDRACSIYLAVKEIKADELAAKMGVDERYLSHMRTGRKPVAMRHRIALLDCPEAVVALQEMEAAEAGITPPSIPEPVVLTDADFHAAAFEIAMESPALKEAVVQRVARNKNVRFEVVAKFLRK